MIRHLHIDYETASLANLKVVGLDNYMKDPSTRILMLAWAIDQGEIRLWFPHEGPMPQELLDAWRDHDVVKVAWSAEFEYNATLRVLPRQCGITIDAPFSEYRDPIVLAHNISLPGKLEKVGEILHMTHQKDARGKELIKMFSLPVSRGGEMTLFGIAPPLFRDHNSHPEQWKVFADYCVQDVRTERDLWYRLSRVPFPEDEWQGWLLNAHINAFGMPVNRQRGEKMLRMAERYVKGEKAKLCAMTKLKNPMSDSQIKKWAIERGYSWNSVRANYVQAELDNPASPITPECREALALRAKIRKSSYKKLLRFLSVLSEDDRLRFQFRYMGAPRTGRWSGGSDDDGGKSVQVQNLSRGAGIVKKKLARALELIDAEDYDGIIAEFSNPDPKKDATIVDVVMTCLRSLFEAKPGKKLEVADLNAIENRVLGWVAACKAILDVFRTCNDCGFLVEKLDGPFRCTKCGCKAARDPYISFGTRLFNKTYAQMWHEYHDLGMKDDRQNSKPAVLGGGFGLGGGDLIKNEFGDMIRDGMWGYAKNVCGVDMPRELAHDAVKIFRADYPEVTHLWTDLEEAFKQVLVYGGVVEVGKVTWDKSEREWVPHTHSLGCVIKFSRRKMAEGGWMMVITLPSGRSLHYLNATIDEETRTSKKDGRPYTSQVIHYDGVEHSTAKNEAGQNVKKTVKWGRVKSYGGKLCLSGATSVVTNRGIKDLDRITLDDLVWDGVQWVRHDGLICNGIRETATWMGLTGTPDHQILGGKEWHELGKTNSRNGLCSLLTGLASALRLWSFQNQDTVGLDSDVTAGKFLMWTPEPCAEIKSMPVHLAGVYRDRLGEQKDSGTISSLTPNSAKCGSENCQESFPVVTIPNAKRTTTTAGGESHATNLGGEAEVFGWNMPLHLRAGITRLLTLIESTTTEIMNQEISDSSLAQKIQTIVAQLSGLNTTVRNFHTKSFAEDLLRFGVRTLSTIISSADAPLNGVLSDTSTQKVYDLLNCGPRHRFMVLTNAGPVIVHNCENIVQAIARDILLHGMKLAHEMGFPTWGLFHDELATEVADTWDGLRVDDLVTCMSEVPAWAPGLLLGAEGYSSAYYKKE